ncbi:MAG: indolepyruvate oxidoreductase subunit beta [Bacteroidales bacterium]|nr:indolepyruvate oxidoreductase subunit beta [Candidatus Colimorpha onthohippi]
MKKDIILCGVGGDGIVSVAKIISDAALNIGLNVKQSEIHGMSQRGGSVFSHLRISSKPIHADVIPQGKADIILSSEPMEALRYLPFLASDGIVITNSEPFINIKHYPDPSVIQSEIAKLPRCVSINANQIAKSINARGNMVLLGAAAQHLEIEFNELEKAIHNIFVRKGQEVVDTNIAAIRAGRDNA